MERYCDLEIPKNEQAITIGITNSRFINYWDKKISFHSSGEITLYYNRHTKLSRAFCAVTTKW